MRRILLVLVVALIMAALLVVMAAPAFAQVGQTRFLPGAVCLQGQQEQSPVISGIVIDDFVFECTLAAPPGGTEIE